MTRSIHTLRRQIKSLRAKKWKWDDICTKLHIVAAGDVNDTGMAYAIANGVKKHGKVVEYEPAEPEVRLRLGLSVICKECHRKIKINSGAKERTKEPHMAWWSKLSKYERDCHIANLYGSIVLYSVI